jgi:hypothetical protein
MARQNRPSGPAKADNENEGFDVPQVQNAAPPATPEPSNAAESSNPEPAVAAPPAPAVTRDAADQPVKIKLPEGLKESIALLQQLEGLPERNWKEELAKAAVLKVIRAHVFKLQQGTEAPPISADDIAVMSKNTARHIKEHRIKQLARDHIEVRELIDGHVALVNQYNTLLADNQYLRDENDKLRAEIK